MGLCIEKVENGQICKRINTVGDPWGKLPLIPFILCQCVKILLFSYFGTRVAVESAHFFYDP